jgi:hypothetical protein
VPLTAKVASAPPSDAEILAQGRRWTETFYARDTERFWDHLGPNLQERFKDSRGIAAFRDVLDAQLGRESSVVSESVEHQGDASVYVRIATFTKRPESIRVVLGVAHDRIVAFGIRPDSNLLPAPTSKLDYQTRAHLRLPFDGLWSVGWGGRTLSLNQHVVMREQRFAYDFLVRENGTTHRNDGSNNSDYFCYGRPILAPAAGRVVTAADGVPENIPGRADATNPAGNYVILDHGGDEYSLLAHLIPGSVTVKPGDNVVAGQRLGQCGNSGRSSEPHLHYHLQNAAILGDADGLPAQFHDYAADGNVVSRGEPLRGQTIRAQR